MRYPQCKIATAAAFCFWMNCVQMWLEIPLCQAAETQELQEARQAYQQKTKQLNESYKSDLVQMRSKFIDEGKLDEAAAVNEEILRLPASSSGANAAPATNLDENLVLYFPLREKPPADTVKDASGKGNDGRITGAEWTRAGVPQGAFAFKLKRKTDAIRVKHNDSLDLQTFTLSAWIKCKDNDGFWNRIIDKDWKHGYDFCLGGDLNGKQQNRGHLILEIMGQGMGSKNVVADGKLHMVAGTYDGNTMKLYIDGKIDNTKNWRGPMDKNDKDLVIGNTRTDTEDEMLAFDGTIAEVRIYSRALNEADVRKLWESSKPSADK